MNIGLIDVDKTRFPNLALGKIAAYHRSLGDSVEWVEPMYWDYDRVYQSKVFTFTPDTKRVFSCEVVKGGTGYDIHSALPDEIDRLQPDYSIYPEIDSKTAYGFLTRGCPNKCVKNRLNTCVYPNKCVTLQCLQVDRLIYPDGQRILLNIIVWAFLLAPTISAYSGTLCVSYARPRVDYQLVSSASGAAFCALNPRQSNMTEEIWKDVKGFEGLYQVSDMGRVRSLDRTVQSKRGWHKFVKGIILKQAKHHYGYLQVSLRRNNQSKSVWVHSLVAQAFIPNPDNLPIINHKSEIKTDNRVENLEWCDVRYNNRYGTKASRISAAQRNDPKKSIPVHQIDKASGQIIASYPSIAEASRQTGIYEGSIMAILSHKPHCFTAGGYKWAKA